MKLTIFILPFLCLFICFAEAQELINGDTLALNTFLNKQAPKFSLTTIEKKNYGSADLKDKILVLNFWFIACGPCRRELPLLDDLFLTFKKNPNIAFFSISNVDTKEALVYIKRKLGLKYELVAADQITADKFNVKLYPTNLIIDKKGVVVFQEEGFHSDIRDRMSAVINQLLK